MTRRWLQRRILAGSCLALLLTAVAAADTVEITLDYPAASLELSREGAFTRLSLPGAEQLSRAGAPALPVLAERILLPEGTRAASLRVESLESLRIPCGRPLPFQPPAILGPLGQDVPQPEWADADPAIYASGTLYPAELALLRGTGLMRGLPIAGCELRPLQYDPAAGELVMHTRLRLLLDLEPASVERRYARGGDFDRLLAAYAETSLRGDAAPSLLRAGTAEDVDPGAYDYLIITETAQLAAWEEWARWKTQRGLPATVVTTEWIAAHHAGRDLAEQMRNFVIEAVQNWGTSYLLLAGDEHIVPSRVSWAFDCEAGFYSDENDLYADLYFADLDGDWDANGNSVFGEVDDQVDLYPDLMVGRAPTDDLEQAWDVVNKFSTYERTPPAGHMMEAFYFAEILWSDPYTDSGIGKDMIGERCMGAYEPIERQYYSQGNETVSSVIDYLNDSGPHLANHAGHANYSVMGCGDGYLHRDDVALLHNGPYYHVLYSIGCWAGAFDYGCIGESFLVNGDGGAIAFVGNSRYGWGSPGNPGMGYSETYDSDFYAALLSDELCQFGPATAWPKILRVPYSQEGNVYRWHQYQVNLFGDPEMHCHRGEILPMVLDAPESVPMGNPQFTATLRDANGPVAGAMLCLSGTDLAGDEIYQVGITDAWGQVIFSPSCDQETGMLLTAHAPEHPSVEAFIPMVGSDPFLSALTVAVDDAAGGNGDGALSAGESALLDVTVKNYGATAALEVSAALSSASAYLTVDQDLSDYGDIGPGAVATGATAFEISVSPLCPEGEGLAMTLDLQDSYLRTWSLNLVPGEVRPELRLHRYDIEELSGDGDGLAEPGELLALSVTVENAGSGLAGPMTVTLSTTDPDLTVLQDEASTAEPLMPGERILLQAPFQVQLGAGCPATGYAELDLGFVYPEGASTDAFLMALGAPGFADDMEGGEGAWTHSGSNDQWHRETARSHSGSHSWYCGDGSYANNTDASLLSPEFVIPEDPELSFWCYFDVTIYGTDGMFIDFRNGGGWETLGYLGSGGALDGLLFQVGWAEYRFDLSEYAPGSTGQVRFRLVTDGSDTDEGFYVDDVAIGDGEGLSTPVGETQLSFSLSAPWPHPATGTTQWRLALPEAGVLSARIYDLQGRLVRELAAGPRDCGEQVLRWDGRGRDGESAAAGVYFLRVSAGGESVTRKVVKLR